MCFILIIDGVVKQMEILIANLLYTIGARAVLLEILMEIVCLIAFAIIHVVVWGVELR
ncbi:hypothetical protein D3C80_2070450 [compost metagenome]